MRMVQERDFFHQCFIKFIEGSAYGVKFVELNHVDGICDRVDNMTLFGQISNRLDELVSRGGTSNQLRVCLRNFDQRGGSQGEEREREAMRIEEKRMTLNLRREWWWKKKKKREGEKKRKLK